MKNNKFLQRICNRVRRTQRKASRSTPEKEETSKPVSRHQSKAKNINSVVEQYISVSLTPQIARGNFLDSSSPSSAAAADSSTPSSRSLPPRMDSNARIASAPLLPVHLPEESSPAMEAGTVSTADQGCLDSHTPPPEQIATAEVLKAEVQCTLSATDSGLCSEEEDSVEDEFLEVFSDEEEEDDGVMEDGWLIPADEVSLDKVVTASGRETVYR